MLIARINLLVTFADYMFDKFHRYPTEKELRFVTNIIVWNVWQMDGITGSVPFYKGLNELPLDNFLNISKMIVIYLQHKLNVDYMIGIIRKK